MSSYIHEGVILNEVIATQDYKAGDILFLGNICCQIEVDVVSGEVMALRTEGVIQVTKNDPTAVFADGDELHWNATNLTGQSSAQDGLMGSVVDGGSATSEVVVYVKLNSTAVPASFSLLGDDDGAGNFSTTTADTEPELNFDIAAGATLASVTIRDGGGAVVFGPAAPIGSVVNVTPALASGTYAVEMVGTDVNGDPVTKTANLTITSSGVGLLIAPNVSLLISSNTELLIAG